MPVAKGRSLFNLEIMKEAYCSGKVSELLKKKGFDEPCMAFWEYELSEYSLHISSEFPINNSELEKEKEFKGFSAPTRQMAMAWLRKKNIGIVPEIHTTQDPKDYYWGACIFYLDKSWDILHYVSEPSKDIVEGYDAVIEAALKYVLENLI